MFGRYQKIIYICSVVTGNSVRKDWADCEDYYITKRRQTL